MRRTQALLLLLSAGVGQAASVGKVAQLETYNTAPTITVSGISSGGYMAVQYHVAHSRLVDGAAVFAGGPFYCAQSNLLVAESSCMNAIVTSPDVDYLVALTVAGGLAGTVDPTAHLQDDKVYLFSGMDDTVVDPKVMSALERYYGAFMPSSSIASDFDLAAEHCMPTLDYGEDCSVKSSPFIGDCNFDGAGRALSHLLGDSPPPSAPFNSTRVPAVPSNLQPFDQTPFYLDAFASIGHTGYVYVPTRCQSKDVECRLHVSFHGCEQNLELVGSVYAEHAGFNEYAENNDVIVLYPYAISNPYVNPNGCWDWWGYNNPYYGLKTGIQIEFVSRMVERITGRVVV